MQFIYKIWYLIDMFYESNYIDNLPKEQAIQKMISDVKKLQANFKKLWIYGWKIDWRYSSIKNTLIKFQIKNRIIKSRKSVDAWRFWPKTYGKLLKKYWNKDR